MALIVEDGTGKADAESYISVADADTYHTARGNTAWTGATAVKEAALRRATDYLEDVYAARWKGERGDAAQALSWPRGGVTVHGFAVDEDEVPDVVSRACAELALRALSADLLADAGAQVKSETVGPISVTYADGARQSTAYKAVDASLSPYLLAGGQIAVIRA